jgi:hypothetical protein
MKTATDPSRLGSRAGPNASSDPRRSTDLCRTHDTGEGEGEGEGAGAGAGAGAGRLRFRPLDSPLGWALRWIASSDWLSNSRLGLERGFFAGQLSTNWLDLPAMRRLAVSESTNLR